MRRIAITAAILAGPAMADAPALSLTGIDMPHHGAPARAAIWHPAGPGGTETIFAANPVFEGVAAMEGAEPAPGRHPVVLLSHGMGGGIESVAWLSAALAERGAIVVAVSHPGTTWSDFDMSRGARHWTRALDMSAALDALLAGPLAPHVDDGRIMAAGFSYGGWTALSLAGARTDHAALMDACREEGLEACEGFLAPSGMPAIDPADWEASYADARVTHAAALDPGLIWGQKAGDVAEISVPVTLVGFGAGADRMRATDFDASGFAALLPAARVERIAPAAHFTGMPLCTPEGAAILASEADDPVCTDPEGAVRAEVHARIVEILAGPLGL